MIVPSLFVIILASLAMVQFDKIANLTWPAHSFHSEHLEVESFDW
jgi:hypothetical protein